MRIAIYGAGSLGTVLGAYLTKAGLKVDLINRNRLHVEGLRDNGAKIIGSVEMQVPVNAFFPEEMEGKYDLIFLMTKQQDNKNVVSLLTNYLTSDGVICTTQNGLPEPSVAEVIGDEKTFGCALAWGATMLGYGVCELTSEPDSLTFSLGSLGTANKQKLADIKDVLEMMGPVSIEENFIGARWSKLMINSAFSGMSAILGATFGEVAENPQSRRCVQKILKECIDVADKAGIKIEPIQRRNVRRLFNYTNWVKEWLTYIMIPVAIKKHASLKASMLQDLEKGKLCEIDAINGIVCNYGRDHNYKTPFNDRVVEIIHEVEKGKYSSSFKNISLFLDLL